MDTVPIATDVTITVISEQPFLKNYSSQGVPNVAAMIRRKLGGCKVQEGDRIQCNSGGKNFMITIKTMGDAMNNLHKGVFKIDRKRTEIVILDEEESTVNKVLSDDEWMQSLSNMIQSSFKDVEAFRTLGMSMAKSMLIHGVSGVGKSTLVRSVCEKYGYKLIQVSVHDLLRIKDEINEPEFMQYNPIHLSVTKAIKLQPCVVVVRNLNAIKTVDSGARDKILAILSNEIDRIKDDISVCITGLAQELKYLPDVLRKTDIFNEHLHLPIPTMQQRKQILRNILCDIPLEPVKENSIEYYTTQISLRTSGYVARDLKSLCRSATLRSMRDNDGLEIEFSKLSIDVNRNNSLLVKWSDFLYALSTSRPSQQLEVDMNLPKRDWAELGGYDKIKRRMKQATLLPLLEPQTFSKLGIKPPSGLLLYGPSGCGKTAFVQALATESMMNVMSIRGPEIFSKYLGETESKIRKIFATAKRIAPCILFIDEMDAISARRGWESGESSGGINERVLSTLLNEMDGVEGRNGVVVIGCTNRPNSIDDAILRPGRLDQLIYMGLPDEHDRQEIIKALMKRISISPDINIHWLGNVTEYCTGADIENIFW
ncbi:P-loop containing nucleoside triphosphate hydrolase protein [Phascolomyces articulosus]|uniref:P-loop containing nucleoside triphosphate hydrolase protein n=1 Tax=Phascolomyces articulosus TaxID=60185 RepID=A0AAD5KGU1_9FUNG|nr:P-loop containing nucleoside triphosphate hydrolase protein [Phascolomyces articulosus]